MSYRARSARSGLIIIRGGFGVYQIQQPRMMREIKRRAERRLISLFDLIYGWKWRDRFSGFVQHDGGQELELKYILVAEIKNENICIK